MPHDLSQFARPNDAPKGVDRRQLLKVGAWAAPVLVLTTASPAMAASTETVPAAQLTVEAKTLSAVAAGVGPIRWAGGSILWTKVGTGDPTLAMVTYSVTLTGPGLSTELYSGVRNIASGTKIEFAAIDSGTAPMAPGNYYVTITAVSNGNASAMSNTVTLVSTPVAVPAAELTILGGTLSDLNTGGTPGQLSWTGGKISWTPTPTLGPPWVAAVTYTALLTGPGGISTTIASGSANINRGGFFTIPSANWGVKPLLGGVYKVTVTATSTASKGADSNALTVIAPVVAALPTVVSAGANKHTVTLKFTGPAGAVINVQVNASSNVSWKTPFPATATIDATGTGSIVDEANATGSAGTVSFIYSGTYVAVTPDRHTNITIPK